MSKPSNQRLVTYGGKTQNLTQWAAEIGTSVGVLHWRLDVGKWPLDKVFAKPVHRLFTFEGKTQTAKEWAAELGISVQRFRDRYKNRNGKNMRATYEVKGYQHRGKVKTLKQWAVEIGLTHRTLQRRAKHNPDKLFTKGRINPHDGPEARADYTGHKNTRRKVGWRPYFTLARGGSLKDPDTGAYIPYTPPEKAKPYEAPPRPARTYTHGGITLTAYEWAERLGVNVHAFRDRLRCNTDTAFTKGPLPRGPRPKKAKTHTHKAKPYTHKAKTYTHGGLTLTKKQWAERLGISVGGFKNRFSKNPEKAFTKGPLPKGRPKKAKPSPEQLPPEGSETFQASPGHRPPPLANDLVQNCNTVSCGKATDVGRDSH